MFNKTGILFTGLVLMIISMSMSMTAHPCQLFAAEAENKLPSAGDASGRTVVRRLPNGLTALIREDSRFPLVSLRLYVHAGSVYERPEQAGISHLLEHMVFKGTKNYPKGAVASEVEKTGGYLNAATSFDYTVYLTDMTREHWAAGLDALADMAFHPTLDPDELEAEKEVVIAELKRGEDNPGQRLFRLTQRTALQNTPYSRPIIGYENIVRSLSSQDIRDYIEALYQPQSMLLLICGDVRAGEALAGIEAKFGHLKNTRPLTPPDRMEDLLVPSGFRAVTESGPWKKVHLSLSLPAPGLGDVRSAQLDVLARLLGGDASSRFHRAYKYEKRLVDHISVSNYSFERLGLISIQATLDADKLPAFWEAFSRDLAALPALAFSREELDRAKLNIEDELFRSKETLAGYASKLGVFAFFGRGERDEGNYLNTVRDTDQAVLTGLLKSAFRPEALSLTVLLPEGTPAPESGRPAVREERNRAETAEEALSSRWEAWFDAVLSANWKAPALDRLQAVQPGSAGGTEIVDLGLGRVLALTPDTTLPYAAIDMVFSGGDSLLAEKDQGLAAFTAALLTKGTEKMSATDMEDYLSDRAASFSASSGRQSFSLSMDSPTRFTSDMFELLQASLVTPAMKDEEASRVSENQIAAITAREDQPTGLAFRRMFPFLFGNHPYGFLQLGKKERVAAFTAEEARDFWREQTLRPWVLSVCGSYDREAVLTAVRKLPVPAKKEPSPAKPRWGEAKGLDLALPGRNQAHLFMIFPTTGHGDGDEAGLVLLENILAGQGGLLFRDLRDEQSLGYTVTAFSWKGEKTGFLVFYIGTDPGKMARAEEGFRAISNRLHAELLPAGELERGRNQMSGDYYREHQSLAARGSEAAALVALKLPPDYSRKLVEKAGSIDAAALQALARKYIRPDEAYLVKVLP